MKFAFVLWFLYGLVVLVGGYWLGYRCRDLARKDVANQSYRALVRVQNDNAGLPYDTRVAVIAAIANHEEIVSAAARRKLNR